MSRVSGVGVREHRVERFHARRFGTLSIVDSITDFVAIATATSGELKRPSVGKGNQLNNTRLLVSFFVNA